MKRRCQAKRFTMPILYLFLPRGGALSIFIPAHGGLLKLLPGGSVLPCAVTSLVGML